MVESDLTLQIAETFSISWTTERTAGNIKAAGKNKWDLTICCNMLILIYLCTRWNLFFLGAFILHGYKSNYYLSFIIISDWLFRRILVHSKEWEGGLP